MGLLSDTGWGCYPGLPGICRWVGGWDPPTHQIRKIFFGAKMKFINGAGKWRPQNAPVWYQLATKKSPECKTKQNLLAFFQFASFDVLSPHVEGLQKVRTTVADAVVSATGTG